MYIIKNALKCIGRAKGRNLLIAVIVFVLAASACIGLSIRQAAQTTKTATKESMSVTATISFDRQSMMSSMKPPQEGENTEEPPQFDSEQFSQQMSNAKDLTLEEYEKYAKASTVKDFFYTQTAYGNGTDTFVPVTTESESETPTDTTENQNASSGEGNFPGGGNPFGGGGNFPMGMMSGILTDSDFTLVGYSSDSAMTEFVSGNAKVTSGSVFEEQTTEYLCMISSELAVYNSLEVNDTVILVNPNNEEEQYTFTICGIYEQDSSNDFKGAAFATNQDPANCIYLSAAALEKLLNASQSVSQTVVDEETGRESETAMQGTVEATYVFADTEGYYTFEEEVRTLGLSDSYKVSSADIEAFENSLTPLNSLSTMAGWFLLVILIIGGVILMVLTIFNIRERKYEIGVLTAMGMKKHKVAMQFICEIFVVTMLAVAVGAGVGAVTSVPVTNALLQNQAENQEQQESKAQENFGRPGNMDFGQGMPNMPSMEEMPQEGGNSFEKAVKGANNYITQIDSAVNGVVLLQMMGVGVLLTLLASGVAVLFVMRYDPLKILANRD